MSIYKYRSYITNENGKNYDKEGLEKSEIYFSDLAKLNDPMEGFIDIFYQGDLVIWKNFFRNYIRSLYDSVVFAICPQSIPDAPKNVFEPIVPFYQWYTDSFEHLLQIEWFNKIPKRFLENESIVSLLECIPEQKVSEEELKFILKSIHFTALEIVFTDLQKIGVLKPITELIKNIKPIDWRFFFELKEDRQIISKKFAQYDASLLVLPIRPENKYLLIDFPYLFIKRLKTVMYPDYYVSCFSRNPKNSSMWGNYANNHRGICLIFKDNDKMQICAPHGASNDGILYNWMDYEFQTIEYTNMPKEINFFETIGNMSKGIFNKLWLTDFDTQEKSKVKLINDKTRETYWTNRYLDFCRKTTDWKYEEECRLIIRDVPLVFNLIDDKSRCIKYHFKDLEGIIFGLKMSDNDKQEIIEVIYNKCIEENRSEFKFYQAYFNKQNGCIDSYEIPIKFTSTSHSTTHQTHPQQNEQV